MCCAHDHARHPVSLSAVLHHVIVDQRGKGRAAAVQVDLLQLCVAVRVHKVCCQLLHKNEVARANEVAPTPFRTKTKFVNLVSRVGYTPFPRSGGTGTHLFKLMHCGSL